MLSHETSKKWIDKSAGEVFVNSAHGSFFMFFTFVIEYIECESKKPVIKGKNSNLSLLIQTNSKDLFLSLFDFPRMKIVLKQQKTIMAFRERRSRESP